MKATIAKKTQHGKDVHPHPTALFLYNIMKIAKQKPLSSGECFPVNILWETFLGFLPTLPSSLSSGDLCLVAS